MSFLPHQPKQRFSLLLLEHGEYYFYDFSANFHPDSDSNNSEHSMRKKIRGRLKVCSKSLVFDPTDLSEPILKIPFKNTSSIEGQSSLLTTQELLILSCDRVISMLDNNEISPFIIKNGPRECKFSLNFAQIGSFLPKLKDLLKISRLNSNQTEIEIRKIVEDLRSSVSFDPSWIVDLHERKVAEFNATRITPLVSNPGRIVITNLRLYFQPYNNIDPEPVHKYCLSDIIRLIKRRHLLRQVAIEIFLKNKQTFLFSFDDQLTRDHFLETLLQSELTSIEKDSTENYTLKWQNGLISNYEYLVYLNSIADRTINDLTQYPVFPWVISDYKSQELDLNDSASFRDLSKPIGALETERLKYFKKRYKEMPEPKFLYGTHYSTPGYVLYYLVRIAPEYMLCLQNGKFDNPDRLFDSISETWESVLSNPSDVKELIPEFYQLPEDEETPIFLQNSLNLDLGTKQNMKKVQDVQLPPWAKDPRDFLSKNAEALESDYVSSHLHEWIDLVFGYKQRGEEAVKADNVFYYLTYEGAVDIDSITDPAEKSSIEMQINEFGQTPKQLFKIPHPRRFIKNQSTIDISISDVSSSSENLNHGWKNLVSLTKDYSCKIHKDTVTSTCLSRNGDLLFSVSQDSSLKIFSLKEKKQIRSITVSELALSSCCLSEDEKSIYVGCWDNNVYIYSIEFGRVLDKISGHDDAVSDIKLRESTLVTASWDSTIKVWDSPLSIGESKRTSNTAEFSEHQTSVTCIDLSPDSKVIVSGGADGSILFWDLDAVGNGCIQTIEAHTDEVTCVQFFPDGQRIACSGKDGFLKVYEIGGGEIFATQVEDNLKCLLTDGQFLLAGDDKGNLRIWDLVTGAQQKPIKAHKGPVTCLSKSRDGKVIVSAGEDQVLQIWSIPI